MKVLVTGATGFLGSRVIALAIGRGDEVRALVRDANKIPVEGWERVEVVQGDVTDGEAQRLAVAGMEGVIHCAAATSQSNLGLEESRRVNVGGTKGAIEAARREERKPRWVQISSMSAHEGNRGAYGRTKLEADEVVRASGLEWTILRPSLIYGPGESGVVAKTLALMKKLPVTPAIGMRGTSMRPVYVDDVAWAALESLARPGTAGKSYMLGGRDEITLAAFLMRLGAAAGMRRPVVRVPVPLALGIARVLSVMTKNPPLTVENVEGVRSAQRVDQRAAEADLGYAPIGFEEGLRRTFGEGIRG
jgi:NADH dehydrogenase